VPCSASSHDQSTGTGSRITAAPRRRIRTSSTSKRYSFGSLTACDLPDQKTLALSLLIRAPFCDISIIYLIPARAQRNRWQPRASSIPPSQYRHADDYPHAQRILLAFLAFITAAEPVNAILSHLGLPKFVNTYVAAIEHLIGQQSAALGYSELDATSALWSEGRSH
jgi:hypothetical protein